MSQAEDNSPKIVIDENGPRWLRELGRFLNLKHLVLVHGNIHDMIAYPVSRSGGDVTWVESRLRDFLVRLLSERGYEVVGSADPVDKLRFATPEKMEPLFRELLVAAADGDRGGLSPAGTPSAPAAGARRPPAAPARQGEELLQLAKDVNATLQNKKTPCAIVLDLASRLVCSPDQLDDGKLEIFTRLLKASLNASEVVRGEARWNNLLVLVCNKLNDLPAFLYVNNPRSRAVHLDLPDRDERRRFILRHHRNFYGANGATPSETVTADFVDLTDGLSHYELISLVMLSRKEQIGLFDPDSGASNARKLLDMYRYGVRVSQWDQADERLAKAGDIIRGAVKGQEEAVIRALEVLARARYGLSAGDSRSQRPRGVLFFAGPTGVGKTEMAKALAKVIFGESERLIRFDMSEYGAEHADQRLLGAPPGYLGYEEGGQLTDAVRRQPFSVLLFDEIEKAHKSIFDKFLQVLDDGRLTDGKGETVYFSECLLIFTSNLGFRGEDGDRLDPEKIDYTGMKEELRRRIERHFNVKLGRPEILNRFGENFVVFDYIRGSVCEEIVDLQLARLCAHSRDKKLSLKVAPEARAELLKRSRKHLHHGGRGIRNVLDAALINPLSLRLFLDGVKLPAAVVVKQIIERDGRTDLTLQWTPA